MKVVGYTLLLLVTVLAPWSEAQPGRRRGPDLSPKQQREYRERWERMGPEERRLLRGRFQRWMQMSPAERQQLRDRHERLEQLPPTSREALRRRLESWSRLSPERRQQMKRRLEYWRRLSRRQKARVEQAVWVLKNVVPEEFEAFKTSAGRERKRRRDRLAGQLRVLQAQPQDRLDELSRMEPEQRRRALNELTKAAPLRRGTRPRPDPDRPLPQSEGK